MLVFIIFLTTNYKYGILKLKKLIDFYDFQNYKIIINSSLKINFDFNYSHININDELEALLFSINYLNINDEDFIIKINGNCTIKNHSPFMKELSNLDKGLINIDVISKYFFIDIIGMKCKYVKMIDNNKDIKIDLRWEKAKDLIDEKKQFYLEYLGLDISQKAKNIFSTY